MLKGSVRFDLTNLENKNKSVLLFASYLSFQTRVKIKNLCGKQPDKIMLYFIYKFIPNSHVAKATDVATWQVLVLFKFNNFMAHIAKNDVTLFGNLSNQKQILHTLKFSAGQWILLKRDI